MALRAARVFPLHLVAILVMMATMPVWAATGDWTRILTLTQAWSTDRATYLWGRCCKAVACKTSFSFTPASRS